ncbi:hypothetical protein [Methyloferula stellata]|jgi:hypothetical protein|uniref:hypothetical protein n=1 Tax=Methyloferula stellata TaxID=876270 RepID=UPI00035C74B8|nr:hypothetical protein [Methyloferula stellata]
MGIRTLALCATASLFLGGVAVAQTSNQNMGNTSGPSAGGNVSPSTEMQSNRSSAKGTDMNTGAGAPGVQAPGVKGAEGSKNGPAPKSPK